MRRVKVKIHWLFPVLSAFVIILAPPLSWVYIIIAIGIVTIDIKIGDK